MVADLEQFRLPDLGEGLTEGEILRWLVAVGDRVELNQPIVEVETAKAAVEVPSPYAGVVVELHHGEGETVDVGTPIITVRVGEGTADTGGAQPGAESGGERTSVLVGYGPRSRPARRRLRRVAADETPAEPAPEPAEDPQRAARVAGAAVGASAARRVLAKPPIRKRAKDLGVDLHRVAGTGADGTITRADVEEAAVAAGPEAASVARPAVPLPGGPIGVPGERIPVRGVRRATAEAMVASAFTAPHVTEFVTVDVTPTMELVARLRALPAYDGVKVSPLLLVARALLLAVRRHPMLNSSWDEAAQEIVVHPAVNLGIAAATPRGLMVPNVKSADRLPLPELARALGELAETARAGRTQPAAMQGGTITITNVGVFGVDTGTPILNPGEAAILCFGAVRDMPWVHEGVIAVRKVTQLGLSFDHRIVDGQLGSQFLADVAAMLADPTLLVAYS